MSSAKYKKLEDESVADSKYEDSKVAEELGDPVTDVVGSINESHMNLRPEAGLVRHKSSSSDIKDSMPGDVTQFPAISVAFRNLNCSVPTVDKDGQKIQKTILSNASGIFERGQMVAIMGPSGSGKTTLLDMIAGKKTLAYTGDLIVNGRKTSPQDGHYQRVIGYVPQESDINGNLTVRECLSFCAALKAQHDDEEKLKKTVDWVLDALSLTDVSEQRVGDAMQRGISGGQKRRVCIGRALVATPGALFMDEPTSGLSATDSLLVMKCIQRITRSFEIIVAAVIHQPRYDVFRRFDQLILLTNGRVAYNGVRSEAIKHFTKINAAYECPAYVSPADHFLDLVTPPVKHSTKDEEKGLLAEEGEIEKTPKHVIITEYFEKNCRKDVEAKVDAIKPGQAVGATISYRPDAEHTAPLSRQIKELLKREIKLNFRDPQKITAKAANAFIMGLLIGAMYYDVKAQYVPAFGYIGLAIVSMSAMVSLPSFYADRLMFNLERMDRLYPTLPFFLVTTGVGLLVSVIFNVLFSVIVWGMTGLGWTHFGRFALIGFTIFWATDGLITWISGACRTMDQAMATFNMTIGIFLLFNGFSANTKTTPYWLNWLCFCSPLYYSLEMFLDTLYGGTEKWAITGELYGMQEHAFWRDFFICLGIGVLGRIMGFFAMKYMHRIQR